MNGRLNRIRQILETEHDSVFFSHDDMETVFNLYVKLRTEVAGLRKYLDDPKRQNKLDIVDLMVKLAAKQIEDYPLYIETFSEKRRRSWVDNAVEALNNGEVDRAKACLASAKHYL